MADLETDAVKTEEQAGAPVRRPGHSNLWTGLFVLVIGVVLLMQRLGAPLPAWLFTWPIVLIVIGLYIGFKHRFSNFAWAVMVLLGIAFLMDQEIPNLKISQFIWPLVIIAIGLLIMGGARGRHRRNFGRWREWRDQAGWKQDAESYKEWRSRGNWRSFTREGEPGVDFLDSTCVFGGVRKVILSKDFKGGDITNFCGGSEIDLTQADIKGKVVLDVTQVFGGTKIIVPAHWEVKSEIVAIFGGIEDKRRVPTGVADPEKVLVLDGTSIFGGIEIRSY